MNKKGEINEILKKLLWIIFFLVASYAIYYIINTISNF